MSFINNIKPTKLIGFVGRCHEPKFLLIYKEAGIWAHVFGFSRKLLNYISSLYYNRTDKVSCAQSSIRAELL